MPRWGGGGALRFDRPSDPTIIVVYVWRLSPSCGSAWVHAASTWRVDAYKHLGRAAPPQRQRKHQNDSLSAGVRPGRIVLYRAVGMACVRAWEDCVTVFFSLFFFSGGAYLGAEGRGYHRGRDDSVFEMMKNGTASTI